MGRDEVGVEVEMSGDELGLVGIEVVDEWRLRWW